MRPVLASILFLACTSLAYADVESGPKAGEKVGLLKVHAVAGTIEDKEVDYAKERKDEPTVYLFVNAEKFSQPMNKFMKGLDGKLGAPVTRRCRWPCGSAGNSTRTRSCWSRCRSRCRTKRRR